MALTGHLSDLSLSELIEFFCNQRKLGLLCVHYPQGSGSFYLQNGSVVDAKIGMLRGIDAVYYALTLPNAAFEFKGAAEASERTINQPWTQVVLEGLRRLDEGIVPAEAFPDGPTQKGDDDSPSVEVADFSSPISDKSHIPAFLSGINPNSLSHKKPLIAGAVAFAIMVSVAVIGVPAGWYGKSKPAAVSVQPNNIAPATSQPTEVKPVSTESQSTSAANDANAAEAATLAAKRQRDRERAKAREEKANNAADTTKPNVASTQPGAASSEGKPGPKKVTVQVSYDESGRVVQASGGDPTALRIARQKRFPAGKAGSATITIPIN
jgi:hypothetical protein